MAAGAGLDLTTGDKMAQAERGCFPKVQILTIEELLAGARPQYPRYAPGAAYIAFGDYEPSSLPGLRGQRQLSGAMQDFAR